MKMFYDETEGRGFVARRKRRWKRIWIQTRRGGGQQHLGELLGPLYGDNQFENIVKFMSGRAPSETGPAQLKAPAVRNAAIVYEGVEAVRKIRDVLGRPILPGAAGSIRREFGQTVMVNAAHASDWWRTRSEIGIINVPENNFRRVIEEFYGD